MKNNITALRRLRKTDNNRIARAVGAVIVNRVEEAKESDLGTKCGLFEVRKIGDEYVAPVLLPSPCGLFVCAPGAVMTALCV